MDQFSFPTFRTTKHRQLVDQGSAITPDETELREPCDFMPQSPALAMFASATQRSHKELDTRALRLLDLNPQNHDSHSEIVDAEELKSNGHAGHADINEMPRTPPLTPFTPTTDSLSCSEQSFFSFEYYTRTLARSRSTAGPVWPIVLLLALVVTAAIMLAILGPKLVASTVADCFQKLWSAITVVSHGLEMGIEGFGWVCWRAVGRFGRGFGNGYRL
ncbi:hypothetical protein HBH70_213290 [Parastagonospora nodorum]|nr:hypothetical protein HBH51_141780 [Parastagonospora nodorum]KAH4027914.1 hypothetical protein HBI13_047660 [Parastagonospora nodorum]KAH4091909.1 hypothetical protein HBH46_183370 [Parastagonospora nodorum]KAH4605936.1 hypothetical protein HBH82_110890 [Parastagonospora nodorum]KAH4663896.1 hypothetical protein HBH78_208090 [Parastagonospora nodorum]